MEGGEEKSERQFSEKGRGKIRKGEIKRTCERAKLSGGFGLGGRLGLRELG